ncbi:hypothetical protein QBC38DRAFT_199678 [Podospora fimiseda]|uniref:Uncharacterized protein n=1 Tax=Podospora fimiseda TaxID=252190 RepID=A0AAN7BPI6_9PEZI|nr:hypothetical protein QBC38DRAFT_199678 [Podospora fimiseda]
MAPSSSEVFGDGDCHVKLLCHWLGKAHLSKRVLQLAVGLHFFASQYFFPLSSQNPQSALPFFIFFICWICFFFSSEFHFFSLFVLMFPHSNITH